MRKYKLVVLFLIMSCGQGELWFTDDVLAPSDCPDYYDSYDCGIYDLSVLESDTYIETGTSYNIPISSSNDAVSSSELISSSLYVMSSSEYSSTIELSSQSSQSFLSSSIIVYSSSNISSSQYSSSYASSSITISSSSISSSNAISSSDQACNSPEWEARSYSAGEIVRGSDGSCYQCKSHPYSGWCGPNAAYAPISGWAWADAWTTL